ncbi:acetyl-CoA synthase subunit gamma [Candidatus Desantisbacteria bacterium]|nr:acetyl-CoA synthase subunit gamma [Candidatus Desantisbacteria bacterium]
MNFIKKWINTDAGKIPVVNTSLDWTDNFGTIKARLTFGRMNYKVEPGIYAVGNPNSDSFVFVSANYKMSFDVLRSNLSGIDAWILVLDTDGINVWCAAGKGTFGTKEIVNRIKITGLEKIVNNRRLIVPQLGAPGVSFYDVKKFSSFSVTYGPVRASDIPEFIKSGMKATEDMRKVRFTLYDRVVLIPAEIVLGKTYLIYAAFVMFVLSGLNKNGYSVSLIFDKGVLSILNVLIAFFAGAAISPLLLPWLPGRSFSLKGFFTGIIGFIISYYCGLTGNNALKIFAWFLLFSSAVSFLTMNFTGASTYTSLSGVKKEMKYAVPMQIAGAISGLLIWAIK